MLCHVTHYIYLQKLGKLGEGQFVAARYYYTFNLLLKTYIKLFEKIAHRRFRGIECWVLKIGDFKKVIFFLFFKHNIAGLGVLIPKRYHMLG